MDGPDVGWYLIVAATLALDAVSAGIHDPGVMPFGVPWTDAEPDELRRSFVRYQWGKRSRVRPEHWDRVLQTNVIGTLNVLEAAERAGVERFVNISTDKAADPTSVLGLSKRTAERLTAGSKACRAS